MSTANPQKLSDLGALFDEYVEREFADHVNATMEAIIPEPYVHCVLT